MSIEEISEEKVKLELFLKLLELWTLELLYSSKITAASCGLAMFRLAFHLCFLSLESQ